MTKEQPKTRNRTIAIPVAEIIEGGTKQEFYADVRATLDLSRRAANRAVSECLKQDPELMTGGKCPKLYTYPTIAGEFPGVAKVAANIGRTVEAKYRQERWHVGSGRKSVCNYRSFPWPLLHNKSADMLQIGDEGEYLTARVKLLGGWWKVRLAGGSSHRDQVRGIREALAIGSIGDSKIWTDRRHVAVLGIAVSLPLQEGKGTRGTLTVCTARDALIVATKERSDVPFVITGDEVRQWVAQRDRRYQRLRQDRKSGSSRQSLNGVIERTGDKWNRRMDSYTHETAAKIVAHAKRRNVATVRWDATIKSFMPKFPYHELATKIAYKCEDAGIEFLEATQTVVEPDVSKPHIYFKFSPETGRVKIGKTGRSDGGRHGTETDSPDRNLTILAVDNQPKSKLTAREKHYHAMFADHRIDPKGEWFNGEAVIEFLRAAGWLGNAGNLSQIAQVLDVCEDTNTDLPPGSSASVPEPERKRECSQDA